MPAHIQVREKALDGVRLAALFFAVLIAGAIAVLCQQNVIFSDRFDFLPLREIDDFAFQVSLRHLHTALAAGHLGTFISCNDYGYGALFWTLNAVATLPGYLLGWDQWVIYVPRLISLLAGVGAVYRLWQITGFYTPDMAIRMAVPALLVLQPEFAFACMRFHTHALALFLCATAFHLALSAVNARDGARSVLAFACAAGVKTNALVFGPVVAGVLLLRHHDMGIRSLAIFLGYGLFGFFAAALAYNPLFLLYPIFSVECQRAVGTLQTYIRQANTAVGSADDINPMTMLKSGLMYNYGGWPLLVVTAGLLPAAFRFWRDGARIKAGTLLVAFAGTMLAVVALLYRVKQGPFAYANYLIVVSFVPLLGVVAAQGIPQRFRAAGLVVGVAVFGISNHPVLDEFYFRYAHQRDTAYTQSALADYRGIESVMKPVDGKMHVLTDYRALLPATPFMVGVQREDFGDNLHVFRSAFDYIVLHKANPAFGDEAKLRADFQNPDNYLQTRAAIQQLLNKGVYHDQKFNKAFENGNVVVFKAQ